MRTLTAQEVGTFRQWPLAAQGLEAFSGLWIHRLPKRGAVPMVLAADETVDLQWIGHRFRAAGPDRAAVVEELPAGTLVVGFRFQPAAASAWLRLRLDEITNQRPDLSDHWATRPAS